MANEEMAVAIANFLRFTAEALVDEPESVSVGVWQGESCMVFSLGAAAADVGKIIGRHGSTAHSLRTILNAASVRSGVRYELVIVEPEGLGKAGKRW